MDEFKNYIAEDNITFCGETKVLFGQCGVSKQIHLTNVMEYCADYLIEMYTQKGQSRQYMSEHGYVQMVSRISVHINELPIENEILQVMVKEEKPEGFQPVRYFEFKSQDGNLLLNGKSFWVIVEPESRRIISPEKFEYLAKSESETFIDLKPGKIKLPQDLVFLGNQKILLSHLDPNGHLTNAKYINFALDFLPEEYQEKEISDFRFNFCKEMKKNEIMHVYGAFDEENKKAYVVGKKQNPLDSSKMESSFECEIFYK